MTGDVPGPDGIERARLLRRYLASGDQLPETLEAPLQRRLREEYGPIYRLAVPFGADVFFLASPSSVRAVLETERESFRRSRRRRSDLGVLFGDGIVTAEGDRWRRRRRVLAPLFSGEAAVSAGETAATAAARKLEEWRRAGEIETTRAAFEYTFDVLWRVLFGDVGDDRRGDVLDALGLFQESFPREASLVPTGPGWLPTPHNRRLDRAQGLLEGAIGGLVREATRSDAGESVLGRLLALEEEEEAIDATWIRTELRTLLVAGLVASKALSSTLYLLAECASPPPTDDGYAGRAVREALRLYPPLPPDVRTPLEPVEIGGHTLPTGAKVLLNQLPIHHDPQFWDRPLRFRPERFAEGWRTETPAFAYYPFGGGPRSCLGRPVAVAVLEALVGALVDGYAIELGDPDADVGENPTDPRAVRVRIERRD